jgi:Rrf2 family nitric oxide-sensitive transcriptional repressor
VRLTSFTDYSLRVLMFLAASPGRRATIGEIARAFDISENHLMKVAHLLGREGLLVNIRGKGGGLELAAAPQAINVGKVVRITEGPAVPAECFDAERNGCVISPLCKLRGVLGEAVKAFYASLDRYTLEDLVRNRQAIARILRVDAESLHAR